MLFRSVDYGDSRTGLAVCDPGEVLATPLKPQIEEKAMAKVAARICEAAREQRAELIVVGLPRNMDGTEGESAQNAREIGALLEESTGLPVEFVDERGTTITAHGYLNDTNTRGKKRKAVVDAVAATVILENFLEKRRMENRG